jgi:TIR domain
VTDPTWLSSSLSQSTAGSPLKEQSNVFISYRHADRSVADELYALLVMRNVSAWYDPLIPHGTDWREAIVENLSTARVMVILLSPAAFESEELKKELAVAVQEGVPLLAVRLQDVKPPGAFAYELARSHWFDLFANHHERLAALADLLEKIARQPREADLAPLLREWQQRWHQIVGGRAGRLTDRNSLLVILLFFVSTLVLLFYERSVRPLEQLTAAGVIAPWRAWFYVVFVSSVGSPILLFSMVLRGVSMVDLPLLVATAANTVILMLLARNLLAWLRLRLPLARTSQ